MLGYSARFAANQRDVRPWSRENERAFSDQIEKGANRLRIAAKMPARLTKHDFCRMQRTATCGKNSYVHLCHSAVY